MSVCENLAEIIRKSRYKTWKVSDTPQKCVIHFLHPSVKPEDVGLFSAVVYDKERNRLETTVRRRVKNYKELYLDYCCENSDMKCRPHIWIEKEDSEIKNVELSIEAKFTKKPLDSFKRLLDDML
ncbi:hypothetical protein DRO24_03520 [Candidatus Bathyarchaeota archaeon]|nr:MAG: hypothetical protein DRO24_03520 [Candidatus Bathyarchaeota archaeon]